MGCVAGSIAIDPALVARAKDALGLPDGERIGLAVSGGPDSMAMLLLAHAAIPGRFEVATVNHGLRPEAAEECQLVVAACRARDVPCEVLRVTVEDGNLQAEARHARYGALLFWAVRRGLGSIATAHHMDDQAETLLMRLNRGSGLMGLSSIRQLRLLDYANKKVRLIRPFLAFRRSELAGLLEQEGVAVAYDPSNRDERFDRVRMRKAIAAADWLDVAAIANSAGHLGDAADAVAWAAMREFKENVRKEKNAFRYTGSPRSAPRQIQLFVAARIFGQMNAHPRGGQLDQLIAGLARGKGGNVGGVLVTLDGEEWVFQPEPARTST